MSLPIQTLSYLRSGLLLHCITLMEIAILISAAPRLMPTGADSLIRTICNAMILVFLASLPLLSQLDARCRYQNYRRVRDQFLRFGFDTRILKPLMKSRCQRDAAWVAAHESGYGDLCRDFFRSRGYRWYHIFPDFLLSNPRFLASRYFWESTFFLKTYNPRINFQTQSSTNHLKKEIMVQDRVGGEI